MNTNFVNHFSSNYRLNISKLPCKAVDRFSVFSAAIFFLLAMLLIAVGIYEYVNGVRPSASEIQNYLGNRETPVLMVSPTLFDVVIVLIGFGIAMAMIGAVIRYKKINFDGDFVRIIIRPAFGQKVRITEPLYLYKGVQLRVEFFQFGLINRNKYIVELLHKDPEKTVPLYISTSKKNIRKIWESYAKAMKLPAIIVNDGIATVKDYQDLDLSLKDLAKKMNLTDKSAPKSDMPDAIDIENDRDKKVIKIRQMFFDAYNIITLILLSVFATILIILAKNHETLLEYISINKVILLYALFAFLTIYCLLEISKRDKLVIKRDKIVLLHKYIGFSMRHDDLYKDKIEEVSITCNPASGRSYISIISDDKSIVFGKKLPLSDLRWLRQYIISELIK